MTDQTVHADETSAAWEWRAPEHGEHFRRCSYCGSVHPGDLADELNWVGEWADQKYGWPHKFYVEIPNRDPERVYVVGGASGRKVRAEYMGEDWVAWADLTVVQRLVVARDGWGECDFVKLGTRPVHHAKFYTRHLRDSGLAPGVRAFIERRCGKVFTFDGTRVEWRTWTPRDVL